MSAPTITAQPISQRIKLGAAFVLSIVATGAASYQWYVAPITGQHPGQAIAGAVAASFSLSNFSYDSEGNYYCIAMNADGTAQSSAATIKAAIGQLDEKYLQRRIYEWIHSIIPLWDAAGTRTTGYPVMVWHMQDITRYATPIIMGRISALAKIGRDAVFAPDNTGSKRQAGSREFMLYLQYFGPGALTKLQKISDATEDGALIATLQQDGIVPVWPEPVADAHVFLDTMPEERATLDIRFRTTSEWFSTIDVIESVDMTGEIVLENADKQEVEIST
jgi:hypothetical protein